MNFHGVCEKLAPENTTKRRTVEINLIVLFCLIVRVS
jgi:hypothetical protein